MTKRKTKAKAQDLVDELLTHGKEVKGVEFVAPQDVIITYKDGSQDEFTGNLARQLEKVEGINRWSHE